MKQILIVFLFPHLCSEFIYFFCNIWAEHFYWIWNAYKLIITFFALLRYRFIPSHNNFAKSSNSNAIYAVLCAVSWFLLSKPHSSAVVTVTHALHQSGKFQIWSIFIEKNINHFRNLPQLQWHTSKLPIFIYTDAWGEKKDAAEKTIASMHDWVH